MSLGYHDAFGLAERWLSLNGYFQVVLLTRVRVRVGEIFFNHIYNRKWFKLWSTESPSNRGRGRQHFLHFMMEKNSFALEMSYLNPLFAREFSTISFQTILVSCPLIRHFFRWISIVVAAKTIVYMKLYLLFEKKKEKTRSIFTWTVQFSCNKMKVTFAFRSS